VTKIFIFEWSTLVDVKPAKEAFCNKVHGNPRQHTFAPRPVWNYPFGGADNFLFIFVILTLSLRISVREMQEK
jgi:hypothetical protein